MSNAGEKKILVLGANGKTGSRIVQRLKKLGYPVQIGSRSANRRFDWEDKSTWKPCLQTAESVYVSFFPDLAAPGAVGVIKEFSTMAVESGVKKLVLLSGRGELEAEQCEEIIIKSGVEWTIVRASWFCQNFSEGNFLEQVNAGYVALPVGDISEPFIDADDIADVAVAALTQPGHNGKLYEVTGPQLLTFEEAVAEIARETGKPIQYEKVTMQAYVDALTGYGLPTEMIALINYLFDEVLDGRNAMVTNGVEQALGRKPTDFAAFVRKTIEAGIWEKVEQEKTTKQSLVD